MNKVVTVMTAVGEYVGRLVTIDETGIVLERPRLITFEGESMGFARGIASTGKVDPTEVTILSPIFMTECDDEVIKAWQTATSGIVMP